MKVSSASAVAVLVCSSVFWGLSWWPLKHLRGLGVGGIPLIFVAYGAVALAFLPSFFAARRAVRRHAGMLLQIAFFGGVANLSFAAALVEGDVVRVMVLFYLLPLWGVLGGAIFLGERLSRLRVLSMFLALGGAFLVLGGFALFQSPPQFIDLVATTAGFCFAMNNLSFRASQELAVPLKVGAMFVGCALAAGVLLSWGAQPFPSELSGSTWSAVVAFGFFVLLITAGTQWGVTHMEAGRSSIIMILELLSAVVSTAVISAHFLTAWETVGATLIVLASLVEARAGPSPDASAPSPG